MSWNGEPLGDIATRLLFENDRVRIWNLAVGPGETQNWHFHERDYVTVAVAGDDITVEFEDGSTKISPFEVEKLRYHGGPHRVHRVVNHTDTGFENVLVELKD